MHLRWKIANWLLKDELRTGLMLIKRSAEKSLSLPNRQTLEKKDDSFRFILEQIEEIYQAGFTDGIRQGFADSAKERRNV